MERLKTILMMMAFAALPLTAFAQAKKPTLMVIPADAWCSERGYTLKDDSRRSDYARALQQDAELTSVISKIGELMAERGFPLKDLGQSMRSGDSLLQRVQADILLEVMWNVNKIGPKQSVTYSLRGLDTYTTKQVAAAGGTGKPSIACEVPVLLQEAVLEQMDAFQEQLQQHFEDLMKNGREVSVGAAIDPEAKDHMTMDTEIEGSLLSDIIDEWMAQHTVEHRYSLSDANDKSLLFEQVRIPLFADNGVAMDTRRFVMQLRKYLMEKGLQAKVVTQGLGRADVMISGKQ